MFAEQFLVWLDSRDRGFQRLPQFRGRNRLQDEHPLLLWERNRRLVVLAGQRQRVQL